MKIPQIQSTTNYNIFQHIKAKNSIHLNREVSPKHVLRLVNDPTFPEKFWSSPVIVNSDFEVIDGQHRIEAAKILKIPVYYLVDENGGEEDIRIRNNNVLRWKNDDFIDYYANLGNEIYKSIKNVREKYKIPPTYINSIILVILGGRKHNFQHTFREGKLKMNNKQIETLENICDLIFPKIKNLTTLRGLSFTRPLVTVEYIAGMSYYFINEYKLLERFFNKLDITNFSIPYVGKYQDARSIISKISYWRPSSVSKRDSEREFEKELLAA